MLLLRSLLVAALICISFRLSAQVVSDFATNAGGWTAPGALTGALTYTATGGNPGGFVSARTPGSINLGATTVWLPYYFEAPATFEGNKSAYYGGNLRYDASQSAVVPLAFIFPMAVITDISGVAIYYHPSTPFAPPAFGTWTNFNIRLDATTGFWKTTDDPAGTAASAALIQSVLSNISSLQIQGLYSNANAFTRIDNVTLYPPINITTQPVQQTVCSGETATFAAKAGNNPNISYQWQFYEPVLGPVDISDTGGYSGTSTGSLSVNTTGDFGGGYYRCRISGTAVDDAFTTPVLLTINPLPGSPTPNGDQSCTPAALTLTATGGTAGQYRWYTLPSGGGLIAGETGNTYTTPLLSTTTTYYVSIDNGTCESPRIDVTATVSTPPTAPSVTNGTGCSPATVTLSASGATDGEYRWYTDPVAGSPIAGEVNSTYTTPSITTTTDYYVSVDNGVCEGPRAKVTATINTPPPTPTATGGSGCSPATITLNANGGTDGQYKWYTTPTGGPAISGQVNSAYTTPALLATTNYYVAVDNGLCESSRTIAIATVNTSPAAPTGTGASVCGSGAVTLSASGGTAGQYRWYTVPTGGTAIAGETNSTYTSPVLSITTDYYVAINNGTCESTRTSVTATVNPLPAGPTTTPAGSCNAASVTLTAAGGTAGQYRWYTTATGGSPIPGAVNSSYITPVLSTTTTFYVSINNGTCESTRVPAVATIGGAACSNNPPVIEPTEESTTIGGTVTVDLLSLISDSDDNLVISTLKIVSQPPSGAVATIDANHNLIVDYAGIAFVGTENITIEICDAFAACTLQAIEIKVDGSIRVFNAVSPGKDGKNDVFFIENIEKLNDTKKNHVSIFNRWGDVVWEANDYNNTTIAFTGFSKNNSELPSGTYYYKIEFSGNKKAETGYLELKR